MGRVIAVIVLAAVHAIWGAPAYLLESDDYLFRAATYSFFHASWWHLAVNCLAIWGLANPKRNPGWPLWIVAYIVAVLVYPLSFRPVVGVSNVLYAMAGLRTPPIRSRWWRKPEVVVFLIVTVALVPVPQFSATTHIAAFVAGCSLAALRRAYLKLTNDARRYY